ncbi:SIS domain-containing protein [Candidatus Kaiserbacteria bacterium]|nr:SIS domain-containing protein [Candidatus Kaiserbacteria bacterium]
MNNLEKIKENKDIASFSKAYFSYVGELLQTLDRNAITDFMNVLEESRLARRTIFIAGNGGSAATASHMGVDFGSAVFKARAGELPFCVYPLTDSTPMITATGNDFGYEHVFTKQLEIQYRDGDILLVISASGNSQNVVNAAEWVRARGGKVLGLLGFDGGKLRGICDVAITAETPKGEYGPVEDIHMILDHMFTLWMHLKFAVPAAQ